MVVEDYPRLLRRDVALDQQGMETFSFCFKDRAFTSAANQNIKRALLMYVLMKIEFKAKIRATIIGSSLKMSLAMKVVTEFLVDLYDMHLDLN